MEINSTSAIEARKELIAGADQTELQVEETILFSDSDLEKLDEYSLANQYELIDNQAVLLKWKICMCIRDKFQSHKLMGQFLIRFRYENPDHALSMTKQQQFNRYVHAGRFCMKHGIKDLKSVGIKKSNIYKLSSPLNMDIADDIYANIEGKNTSVDDVKRMIEQAKAVLTIEKPEKDGTAQEPINGEESPEISYLSNYTHLSENELYPLLAEYLKSKLKLCCLRIDEKRSGNQRGKDGNLWLHPDIVAMEALDKGLNEATRTFVKQDRGQRVLLWSFEVKTELNGSNVRRSFFQAVSNSSWANKGYLVAAHISDKVEQELKMLSELHGIGVILLDQENSSKSETFSPAKQRPNIDAQSVHRITEENEDFKDFMDEVNSYCMTGRTHDAFWL
jgi:hypothetical protein